MAELWPVRIDLYKMMRRRLIATDLAADVVADTFVVAWRRLEQVPSEMDLARAWVFITARNVMANALRRMAHQARVTQAVAASLGSEGATDGPSVRLEAMDAFESLSPDDRTLLGLVASSDPSLVELARELGCSESAAATRLWRARRRLTGAMLSWSRPMPDGRPRQAGPVRG